MIFEFGKPIQLVFKSWYTFTGRHDCHHGGCSFGQCLNVCDTFILWGLSSQLEPWWTCACQMRQRTLLYQRQRRSSSLTCALPKMQVDRHIFLLVHSTAFTFTFEVTHSVNLFIRQILLFISRTISNWQLFKLAIYLLQLYQQDIRNLKFGRKGKTNVLTWLRTAFKSLQRWLWK